MNNHAKHGHVCEYVARGGCCNNPWTGNEYDDEYDKLLEQLRNEIDDGNSLIWNALIIKLKKFHTIQRGYVYFNLNAMMAIESTTMLQELHLLKYSDFWLLRLPRLDNENDHELRSAVICVLDINRWIINQSFEQQGLKIHAETRSQQFCSSVFSYPEMVTHVTQEIDCPVGILRVFFYLFVFHNALKGTNDIQFRKFEFCFGSLLWQCPEIFVDYFYATPREEIKSRLSTTIKDFKFYNALQSRLSANFNLDINAMSKKLKKFHDFEYYRKSLRKYLIWMIQTENTMRAFGTSYGHLLMARCYIVGQAFYQQIDNIENKQWTFDCYQNVVSAILKSYSLYAMALSFRSLSALCSKIDQFVFALRLLNAAHKCCCTFERKIMPSFVNQSYPAKREEIKRKIDVMVCGYCNENKGKLLCCTGCMEAVYCSKSCQKKDWRLRHRVKCGKLYYASYKALKKKPVLGF